MKFKFALMIFTFAFVGIAPAFAASQSVVTHDTSVSGGTTTTTTTRYYYDDSDVNRNGILDSEEFGRYVYNRWDRNADGFITDDEWNTNTVRWYPEGYSEYKTYAYWDKDHDARLDANEFGTVVTTTKLYDTWDVNADKTLQNDEYAKSTFNLYDLDNDGSLSMEEWVKAQ